MKSFEELFRKATNNKQTPFRYQTNLAECRNSPSLLEVPTGMGKTAAAVLSWIWRRRYAAPDIRNETPRRLVYCLPMRVLVEQTRDCAVTWLHNLGLLGGVAEFKDEGGKNKLKAYDPWDGNDDPAKIRVHLLMGGEVDRDWDMYPERDAILIGTQDMLLSRALNRGYALSRFRWPVQFGLLNNDCLWVMDEIQLMGNGLGTTTQLQAFRRLFTIAAPVRSLWMSATMHEDWLKTVDFDSVQDAPGEPQKFDPIKDIEASAEMKNRWEARKPIEKAKNNSSEIEKLAKEILCTHQQRSKTLVVMNTVKRARALHDALQANNPKAEPILIHSRFRPIDRKDIIKQLSNKPGDDGVIIVSTQVIEAGVDISAQILFTELAPWPSMVQRFGRCNRLGKDNQVAFIYWIDVPTSNKNNMAPPYEMNDLNKARKILENLNPKNVGPKALHDNLIRNEINQLDLYHYEHTRVIRQHDLHGLFATEPDLAGGFTDISNFIRNRERDSDVQVYWRSIQQQPDPNMQAPHHDELCMVRFYELATFLGKKGYAWEWNYETGKWRKRFANEIRPGMTLLLALDQGGYNDNLGWTGDVKDKATQHELSNHPQEFLFYDQPSQNDWYALIDHLRDAEIEAQDLIKLLGFDQIMEGKSVIQAAKWHDIGKSINRWQNAVERYALQLTEKSRNYLCDNQSPDETELINKVISCVGQTPMVFAPWAKFPNIREIILRSVLPDESKKTMFRVLYVPFRPNLRHEAASALAAWHEWLQKTDGWTALAVYLVACHHGKVRTVLRSTGQGDDVFGIRDGDTLPATYGWIPVEQSLDLSMKNVGACGLWGEGTFTIKAPSWFGMIAELLGPELPDDPDAKTALPDKEPRRLGPFRLAFFEALIRAVDVKASRNPGRGVENHE